MLSPYYGVSFFQFFAVFFSRLFKGELFVHLYIDDIQVLVFFALAASGAFVGTFLVLRKMAMYANAVSHTVMFGLVCVCLFTHDLSSLSLSALAMASLSTALLTGFLIYFLRNVFHVHEEASTALVFSLLFSLGLLLLVLLTRNAHIGTELILGNADSLVKHDLFPVSMTLLVNGIITLLCFRYFITVSFDGVFSYSIGIPIKTIDYLIIFQISASLVSAFKAVGVLMALAFLLIPGLIAKVFVTSVRAMLGSSLVFGCLAALLAPASSRAILSSYHIGFSTSGLSVFILLIMYFLTYLFRKIYIKYIRKLI